MAKSKKTGDSIAPAADRAPNPQTHVAAIMTDRDIAHSAYDLFLARGGAYGHNVEDWLPAERELLASSR